MFSRKISVSPQKDRTKVHFYRHNSLFPSVKKRKSSISVRFRLSCRALRELPATPPATAPHCGNRPVAALLPGSLLHSGDEPFGSHLAELDTADTELAHVSFGRPVIIQRLCRRMGFELRGSLLKPSWSPAALRAARFSAYLFTSFWRFTSRAFIDSFAISNVCYFHVPTPAPASSRSGECPQYSLVLFAFLNGRPNSRSSA